MLALIVFLWPSPALAACQPSTQAMADTMVFYRALRAEEAEVSTLLETTAVRCRADGEAIAARAARAAEARSCEAQREAGALEGEARAIGTKCSEEYTALLKRQQALKKKFLPVYADVLASIKVIDSERTLFRRYCAEDVDVSDKMAATFLALSLRIDSAGTLAQTGAHEYGALAGTAGKLAVLSSRHLASCGAADAGALPLSARPVAEGAPAAGPAVAPRPRGAGSDLTGTNQAIQQNREAQALIEGLR